MMLLHFISRLAQVAFAASAIGVWAGNWKAATAAFALLLLVDTWMAPGRRL